MEGRAATTVAGGGLVGLGGSPCRLLAGGGSRGPCRPAATTSTPLRGGSSSSLYHQQLLSSSSPCSPARPISCSPTPVRGVTPQRRSHLASSSGTTGHVPHRPAAPSPLSLSRASQRSAISKPGAPGRHNVACSPRRGLVASPSASAAAFAALLQRAGSPRSSSSSSSSSSSLLKRLAAEAERSGSISSSSHAAFGASGASSSASLLGVQAHPLAQAPSFPAPAGQSERKEAPVSLTPRRNRMRTKTYDRFIPNRQVMDMATCQFNLKDHVAPSPKRLDEESLAYQEQVARACGMALGQRILTFAADPPPSDRADADLRSSSWNRPLRKPNAALTKRRIPLLPHKILDAPGLVDDYYLNLLDWSSRNMLAVGLESTVYLWNAETGDVQEFCTTKDTDSICSLQWSHDGGYLGVGTHLGDVQIWDVESGAKLRTMRGHASRVGVLAWDKHILSSGARDGSIWHHDVRVPQHKVAELLGHSAEVCGLKWRADGQQLASGGNDNALIIWDAQSSHPKHVKTEHMAAVKAIAWCPWQLTTLATGGGTGDKNIHFWNSVSGTKLSTIPTGSQVTSLVWSKEYKELLSSHGFPHNQLSLWSYPTGRKIADLPGHDCRVLHTSLSPDGQTVVSGAADENLKFWSVFESRKAGKKGSAAVGGGVAGGAGEEESKFANSFKKLSIR